MCPYFQDTQRHIFKPQTVKNSAQPFFLCSFGCSCAILSLHPCRAAKSQLRAAALASFARGISDARSCSLPMSNLSSLTTMVCGQRMSPFWAVFLQF